MKYNQLLLLLILVFLGFTARAQDAGADSLNAVQGDQEEDNVIVGNPLVDSLKLVLDRQGQDTARVNTLNAIAYELFTYDTDEAIRYGTEAKNLAEKLNYQRGLAFAYKNIGLGYYYQGKYAEVWSSWDASLNIFEKLGDDLMVANIKGNIGAIYFNWGQYPEALKNYLPAFKIAEELGDSVNGYTRA